MKELECCKQVVFFACLHVYSLLNVTTSYTFLWLYKYLTESLFKCHLNVTCLHENKLLLNWKQVIKMRRRVCLRLKALFTFHCHLRPGLGAGVFQSGLTPDWSRWLCFVLETGLLQAQTWTFSQFWRETESPKRTNAKAQPDISPVRLISTSFLFLWFWAVQIYVGYSYILSLKKTFSYKVLGWSKQFLVHLHQ